jgi:hypothetical protein
MDAAELIDPRPNDDAPLAFWHDRLVLSVHHDGAGAMPTESKIMTGHLVHSIIFRLTGEWPTLSRNCPLLTTNGGVPS